MNKTLRRLIEPGKLPFFILAAFAVATLIYGMYTLAAIEGGAILLLVLVSFFVRRGREKSLKKLIESITYDKEGAKSSTLTNFPLPIVVFTLDDSRIIWGNELFFHICGDTDNRLDAKLTDLVPQFSAKWMLEGKTHYPTLLEIGQRKYQLHGSLIHSDSENENSPFRGIAYWVDVTDYDNIRIEYENSRPVTGIIILDNLDELTKNLPERLKNDIRDAIEEKLSQWCAEFNGIIRRYARDRYLLFIEHQDLEALKADKFSITEQMHEIENPGGIAATISIGLGSDTELLGEALQFADTAAELALSRGGDQTVIKSRMGFEFFGGRGFEIEKRTKVRSRVMANAFAELIKDSSNVLVMGHRFADLDSLGAAVGVCCLCRNLGVKASIVLDMKNNAAQPLIQKLRAEAEYRDIFLSPQEAMAKAGENTLLAVVDTNRPEQLECPELLPLCPRVSVIDHHRVGATYIRDVALGFVEPYASSACELMTEILQELSETAEIRPYEADALLSGIVLDTKSFSIRTGERTFDAAAVLRRFGADTAAVKHLFQTDMDATISKYKILQSAKLYRQVAVASPEEPQDRIVAAQAADELLNISGVDASIVVAPGINGGIFASARSIGDINVQILMEKLGGGGNRSAAAVQFSEGTIEDAVNKVYAAIDDYLG